MSEAVASAPSPVKLWSSFAARIAAFAVVLLLPAGTWRWWEGWAVIVLFGLGAGLLGAFLSKHDPELLAERMKMSPVQPDQKRWDKLLTVLLYLAGIGMYVVPGFDVRRFAWSEPLPLWLELLAMVLFVPGFLWLRAVMKENTYLSHVVKLDEARHHHVITTGPYALVRHPMYCAVIVLVFAFPVALGSRWGLVPAGLLSAVLLVRTAMEDRTLHRELPGYPEYAAKTRYRLIPGIW